MTMMMMNSLDLDIISTAITSTVEPVYSDRSWDQCFVVCIDRWSLYTGTSTQRCQTYGNSLLIKSN